MNKNVNIFIWVGNSLEGCQLKINLYLAIK